MARQLEKFFFENIRLLFFITLIGIVLFISFVITRNLIFENGKEDIINIFYDSTLEKEREEMQNIVYELIINKKVEFLYEMMKNRPFLESIVILKGGDIYHSSQKFSKEEKKEVLRRIKELDNVFIFSVFDRNHFVLSSDFNFYYIAFLFDSSLEKKLSFLQAIIFLIFFTVCFVFIYNNYRIKKILSRDLNLILSYIHNYHPHDYEKNTKNLDFFFREFLVVYQTLKKSFDYIYDMTQNLGNQKEDLRKELFELNEEMANVIHSLDTGLAIIDIETEKTLFSNNVFQEINRRYPHNLVDFLLNINNDQTNILKIDEDNVYRTRVIIISPGKIMVEFIDISKEEKTIFYLKKAKQFQKSLLNNLSHELRTPLTPIISLSQFLLQDKNIPDSSKNLLQLILTGGEKLLFHIDNLLFYTQSTTENDKKYLIKEYPIEELLHKSLIKSFNDNEIKNKRIKIKKQGEGFMIRCQYELMLKVIHNAINNAIKFAPMDTEIEIQLSIENNKKILSIKNEHQMDYTDEMKMLILSPFMQYDVSETRKYWGLGLGLPLIKNACSQMGIEWNIRIEKNFFTIQFSFS